jgi:hypothetical protein
MKILQTGRCEYSSGEHEDVGRGIVSRSSVCNSSESELNERIRLSLGLRGSDSLADTPNGLLQGSGGLSASHARLGHHQGYGDATSSGGEEFARCSVIESCSLF